MFELSDEETTQNSPSDAETALFLNWGYLARTPSSRALGLLLKAKPSKQTTEPFRKSIQRPILGSPSFPVLASGLERLQRDLALEMFAGISFNQVAVSWHTGIGERLRFWLCGCNIL